MKILTIILGVLMLAGGIYCLFTPIETYSTLAWLIGLLMLIEGFADVLTWNDRRNYGFADGWTLFGAIVSIVLGVVLLVSVTAQLAVDVFIAYLIAAWLVVAGITRAIAALSLRSFKLSTGSVVVGSSWGALLAMGILITALGVLCFFNPTAVMAGVGFMLGLAIACVGVGIIGRGVQMA